MCNGTKGHHYSTSNDGLNFTSPLRTGIGGCGLNFVKLNNGSYRLYTTTKVVLENGTESINSTSSTVWILVKDNGAKIVTSLPLWDNSLESSTIWVWTPPGTEKS